ncbi:MAG: C1 family peptidase, partial [Ferruginibacter sp.]
MKRIILFPVLFFVAIISNAQLQAVKSDIIVSPEFTLLKNNAATTVKNQERTGTCWAYSTTSLLESQLLKNNAGTFDLSEMFTVRNIYIEKAKNYILRLGHAQFGEGGLGHDVIRSISKYGAMTQESYNGLKPGDSTLDHQKMVKELKDYLDALIKASGHPLAQDWLKGYNNILDNYMGTVPASFTYNGKAYTPTEFAKSVMKFNADDYVNITSFTHQPYYQSFVVQVPDNFSNGNYYNLPLNEMIDLVKSAINGGYSIMWDADVSNNGFRTTKGLALFFDPSAKIPKDSIRADMAEAKWDPAIRQDLYEELVTQDDHLMHITGLEK